MDDEDHKVIGGPSPSPRRGRPALPRDPQTGFGKAISGWFSESGISQATAAQRLGVSLRTLQHWLAETVIPSISTQRGVQAAMEALRTQHASTSIFKPDVHESGNLAWGTMLVKLVLEAPEPVRKAVRDALAQDLAGGGTMTR